MNYVYYSGSIELTIYSVFEWELSIHLRKFDAILLFLAYSSD